MDLYNNQRFDQKNCEKGVQFLKIKVPCKITLVWLGSENNVQACDPKKLSETLTRLQDQAEANILSRC